jgi:hypothetical protein
VGAIDTPPLGLAVEDAMHDCGILRTGGLAQGRYDMRAARGRKAPTF